MWNQNYDVIATTLAIFVFASSPPQTDQIAYYCLRFIMLVFSVYVWHWLVNSVQDMKLLVVFWIHEHKMCSLLYYAMYSLCPNATIYYSNRQQIWCRTFSNQFLPNLSTHLTLEMYILVSGLGKLSNVNFGWHCQWMSWMNIYLPQNKMVYNYSSTPQSPINYYI